MDESLCHPQGVSFLILGKYRLSLSYNLHSATPTELLNSQCYQSGNTVNFIRDNGKHLPKIFCTKLDEDISG